MLFLFFVLILAVVIYMAILYVLKRLGRLPTTSVVPVSHASDGIHNVRSIRSHGESIVYSILKQLYPTSDIKINEYYNWIRNPYTRHPLQLDFYLPEHRLAIEVDGNQHNTFTPAFHKTIDDYIKSVMRDSAKNAILSHHNIKLVRISYNDLNEESIKKLLRAK